MNRLARWGALLLAVVALGVSPAVAQGEAEIKAKLKALQPKDFPKDPLELVVVYPAGGGMDITARILAKYLEKWTDHKVIVTNKAGGGGMVGHTFLSLQAPNDGHTIGVIASLYWGDGFRLPRRVQGTSRCGQGAGHRRDQQRKVAGTAQCINLQRDLRRQGHRLGGLALRGAAARRGA